MNKHEQRRELVFKWHDMAGTQKTPEAYKEALKQYAAECAEYTEALEAYGTNPTEANEKEAAKELCDVYVTMYGMDYCGSGTPPPDRPSWEQGQRWLDLNFEGVMKENFSKFADAKTLNKALKGFEDQGLKVTTHSINDEYFVFRVDGDQDINGKHYEHNKIAKPLAIYKKWQVVL